MLTTGSVVHDENSSLEKWTVLGFLGKGTCCEVYQVQSETQPHVKAALKVYKEGLKYERAHDGEAMLLDLVSRANGPCKYLVKTIMDFDFGEKPCLVQELLDRDLRQLTSKVQNHCLSMFLIQKLTRDIMRGLHHLHKSGFVHGDIKPTNLMWSPEEYCMKIIDFSLSYHVQDKSIGLLQSQGYRAPETEYWNACCTRQSEAIKLAQNSSHLGTDDQSVRPDVIDPGRGSGQTLNAFQPIQNLLSTDLNVLHTSEFDFGMTGHIMEAVKCQAVGLGNVSDSSPAAGGSELSRTLLLDSDLRCDRADECPMPSRAADVWSVGCIILEMFYGTKMFTANKLATIRLNQNKGVCLSDCLIQAVDDIMKDCSRAHNTRDKMLLKQFIIRCLSVSISQRWSAEEALQHEFLNTNYVPSFEDLCVLHSPIIRLINVIEMEGLANSEKYQDMEVELREECQKYGNIVTCVIPRSGDGAGKAYLEYGSWQQAELAYSKLCHRVYNHHNVIVTYFSVDDFRSQTYF